MWCEYGDVGIVWIEIIRQRKRWWCSSFSGRHIDRQVRCRFDHWKECWWSTCAIVRVAQDDNFHHSRRCSSRCCLSWSDFVQCRWPYRFFSVVREWFLLHNPLDGPLVSISRTSFSRFALHLALRWHTRGRSYKLFGLFRGSSFLIQRLCGGRGN